MRKRRIVRAAIAAVLMTLAMTAGTAGRAAAQSNDTPWLGVSTQQITSGLRDGLDYQGSGVLVSRVVNDSPADRAGIRNGDVIVSFNSRTVSTPQELTRVVRASRVGQSVSVTIVREGDRRSLNVRLGSLGDAGDEDWSDRNSDEDWEAPTPPTPPTSPRAPRAPRAPSPPSTPRVFSWNGDGFDENDSGTMFNLRGLGRGRLGVQVQELNEGLAEALNVPGGKGVLVMDVVKDTPAERAGMRAGDVIVRVGDRSIGDVDELHQALDEDGRVSVTVIRRGERRTLEAELERNTIRRGQAIRIPDIRTRVMRDRSGVRDWSDEGSKDGDTKDRDAMERELRDLRQQVRELQRKLEDQDRN
jgi:C-terminal processing protease CtpA/Prc